MATERPGAGRVYPPGGMGAQDVDLAVSCAVIVALACAAALLLRRRTGKDRTAAITLAAPAPGLIAFAAAAAVIAAPMAAVPLVTVAALCLMAAWILWPTPGSRFADFERQFWAHVRQQARSE